MAQHLTATDAIHEVLNAVTGLPVYIAGSSVAAIKHPLTVTELDYGDVDIFCASQTSMIAAATRLQAHGFEIHERHKRVWQRWMAHGFNKWHTNSLKLTRGELEVNIIYKLVNNVPTTTLSSVLETFDFGLLAVGIDARDGIIRDMRSYFFPQVQDVTGPLPMLPVRREAWRAGFISQYQGLREVGRYVKYSDYGYDLSLVKDDLLTGYRAVAEYLFDRGDADKVQLSNIYSTIADDIELNDLDKLREVSQEIMYLDDLDIIMERLE